MNVAVLVTALLRGLGLASTHVTTARVLPVPPRPVLQVPHRRSGMALRIKESCQKAPADTLKQTVDFGPDLPAGVTLSSVSAVVASGGGSLSVGASPTNDDTTATMTITGGTRRREYEIALTGTYSDGQVRTFEVGVLVL